MKKSKTAILFGTFDIVHQGHLNLFKQARKKCNYLITVIARDKTVKTVKKKSPVNLEKSRLNKLKKYKVADKVVLGSLDNKFAVIKKYKPDVVLLGYDQTAFTENLKTKLQELNLKNTKIIRLRPCKPEIYKTSKILNSHKSVGAIIRNKTGKILMLDRNTYPFGWACPAGHVEKNEKPEEALIREVKEETNLNVRKYKLLLNEFAAWNKCSSGFLGHDWYLYEVLEWSGELATNRKEEKELTWKAPKEIKKLKLEKAWDYYFKKLKII